MRKRCQYQARCQARRKMYFCATLTSTGKENEPNEDSGYIHTWKMIMIRDCSLLQNKWRKVMINLDHSIEWAKQRSINCCKLWLHWLKKSRKDMNSLQFFLQKQLLHHSSYQVAAGVTAAWRLEAARGVRHASCSVDAAPQTRCRRFVGTALLKSIAVVNNASRMQQLSLPCRWRVASCESRLY